LATGFVNFYEEGLNKTSPSLPGLGYQPAMANVPNLISLPSSDFHPLQHRHIDDLRDAITQPGEQAADS